MHFGKRSLLLSFLVSVAIALMPLRARATAITINGTCEFGNCTFPGTLTHGTISGHFYIPYQFANSDRYLVVGDYVFTNTGGTAFSFGFDAEAVYRGNSFGTTSGNDVLTVDFLENFQSFITSDTFLSNVAGAFQAGIAPTSSYTFDHIVGGNALPLLGPFFPPGSFSGSNSFFLSVVVYSLHFSVGLLTASSSGISSV